MGRSTGESAGNQKLSVLLSSLYISQVLGHQVPEQLLPEVALVGELSDTTELGKLLQLVLGCAISCERKQGM